MNAFSTPQDPFWPMQPKAADEQPMSFTRSFGYTMLALRLRFLAGSIPGITSAKRQALSALADGIEAGVCNDPEGMRRVRSDGAVQVTARLDRSVTRVGEV